MISSLAGVSLQSTRSAFAASASADRGAAYRSGEAGAARASSVSKDSSGASSSATGDELSVQELRLVADLRQTDRQVRAHEQAHLAAGAGLVRGGATYTYETGPDEKRYAVAGEVSIDVTSESTPQETLVKARQIRAAALAPADPSAQDQNVAARATSMASEALAQIAAQQRETVGAQAAGGAGAGFYRDVARADGSEGASAGAIDVYA